LCSFPLWPAADTMPFQLAKAEIDTAALLVALRDTRAGACVTFEGRVRAQNEGRAVRVLEYEAYGPLAEKEGGRILAEAAGKFPIIGATCVHRTGRLELGDLAVWVAVTAAHRGAAFEACRYVIDQVKERVPIWKKEHYADGATEWINCAPGAPPTSGSAMK
jgi:molybdopterin synthase catalytic subunit